MQNDPVRPAVLIVLDGWGWREDPTHNAIAEAHTPYYDHLLATYPHAVFDASGSSVGLPDGQMGNSEIGHMAIGAGMPIDTDLVRINKAIDTGHFVSNPAFVSLFSRVQARKGTLHVVALMSDGGVHSHEQHVYEFVRAARAAGIPRVLVHAILDGRDTPPQSGATFVRGLERLCAETGARIASLSGRFYAMDRDSNWDRVDRAVSVLEGNGPRMQSGMTASAYLADRYRHQEVDEHLEPVVVATEGGAHAIEPGDGVFVANFRADRVRMLTTKLCALPALRADADMIVTMTEYDPALPVRVAFPPVRPEATLASEVSRAGLTQVHVAETEKYAHATYFLNGGREEPYPGEEHVLIESRKDVRTHDLAPEMRAAEIAAAAEDRLRAGVGFVFINFANADMVGHTAHVPAIRAAVEAIDRELERIVRAVEGRGGFTFITADHGNAEQNFDVLHDAKHTAHTTNKVPAILTDNRYALADGVLPDVAPTVLSLMGLSVPSCMTGVVRASLRT